MNSCNFLGRLTRDIEMRFLPNNTAVADFGIAINERVKRGDEWVDEPVFLDVTAFGKSAESIAKFFGKGSLILLECRARYESWEEKQTGAKRSKVKFIVNRWHFTGERSGDRSDDGWGTKPAASSPADYGASGRGHNPVDEDSIPFAPVGDI